jgi:FixJ family two-component response regulator
MILPTTDQHNSLSFSTHPSVFVVDGSVEPQRRLVDAIRGWGHRAETFDSAEAFFAAYERSRPGCLVVRNTLPGMDVLQLMNRLHAKGLCVPVIVVADEIDVEDAVKLMQQGALMVLTTDSQEKDLREWIRRGLEDDAQQRQRRGRQREMQRRLARLSPAENEVLELMIAGKANKNIARQQSVSLRTVETRRQQVFQKMEADSLAELILMVVEAKTGQCVGEHLEPALPSHSRM